MYSARVTAQAIAAANAAQGWDLVEHTHDQIDAAIAHFDGLWDPETGQLSRKLTTEESRFISNERRLCALDFRYFKSHYAWIVNKEQKPERFHPNVAQGMLLEIWSEFEDQARAIHLQNLKARRLGVSTITELAVQHRFQFHPYSNCVVASSDPDKSVQMAKMIDFSLSKQPWWLLPTATKQSKNMVAEFGDIHTTLTIQAGNQFTGVARGATPSVVHLSELSSWVDAESLVDAALYRAIIDHPDVFCILESTAEGRGNWWHRTWEQNKKDWDRGRGRVRPVFLPWYVGTDLYPSATDLRARPIPSDWQPNDRTIRHAERARAYVLANPLLFQYLAKGNRDWQMPKAQMWFHEIEYETALAKKELNLFLSELPADDIEAFQSDAISVVDQEVILNYRERVREPWGVFTVLGRDIPQSLTVSRRQWDLNKPPITVKTGGLLRLNDTYTLQPLLWDGWASAPDTDKKLFVWEPPQDDIVYGQGVDTGDGLGQDGSVIEMLRKGTPLSYPALIAEFHSSYIKAFQFWPMTLALACWYSTHNSKVGKRVQIRSAIECRTNGEAVQHEMQKRGWWNFHPWKRYDNRRPIADGKVHKLGVFTNEWFRSQMMDYILTLLDEESLDVFSPKFIDEMASIERDPDEQKAQAAYGENDDRFMAAGFILFSMYVDDINRRTGVQRPPPPIFPTQRDEGSVDRTVPYATFQPSMQSLDIGNRLALPVVRGRGRSPSTLGGLRRPHSGRGW